MTYTGFNVTYVVVITISTIVFLISLFIFIKLYNVHSGKTRFIKNILMSLMICTLSLSAVLIIFGAKIDELKGLTNLISLNLSNDTYSVKLNENKKIERYPSYGYNYGSLKIQSLDINKKIYFGDTTDLLNVGVCQSTFSEMPTEGGVTVLSAHNNKNMLYNLKDISLKDVIELDLSYANCKYKVVKIEILNDTQIDKLTKQNNKETLVIYTCYPFDSYIYTSKRFVVFAVLDSINWK